MDLSSILAKAAPWLAAAAAGPAGLAGMAIKTVAEALGATPETEPGELAAAVAGATPEQLTALKQAEMDFKLRMQELGFKQIADLEAIAAGDRKDARAMQVARPSVMPALLSASITAGYFLVLVGMMTDWLKLSDSQALLIMLGSLSTAWGGVIAYWFGSTRSSESKTALLAQAGPVKHSGAG
jgi:hypothetical protein